MSAVAFSLVAVPRFGAVSVTELSSVAEVETALAILAADEAAGRWSGEILLFRGKQVDIAGLSAAAKEKNVLIQE